MKRGVTALLLSALASLIGCGGGGGGGGGGAAAVKVTLGVQLVTVSGQPSDVSDPDGYVNAQVTGDFSSIFVGVQSTYHGVALANVSGSAATSLAVTIKFRPAGSLPSGTYEDDVDLHVCLDEVCRQPVDGSPFRIKAVYTVSGSNVLTAPIVASVPTSSALSHDVVDAEFSKSMGAIVMVSAVPTNALYVYDLATRTEKSVPLNKVPTVLALSPDGTKAAVGHDALITHVDLAAVGASNAVPPKLLNLSTTAFDLILDRDGYAYVFPAADQWVNLHVVNTETNAETTRQMSLYAKTVAKLAPSGDAFYKVDTMLSPQNIERYSISSGITTFAGAAPYWGDFPMCGGMWFSEDGTTIFTPCGNTFRASDLVYSGRLPLTTNHVSGFQQIMGLSESTSLKEIALLDSGTCGAWGGTECDTLIRLIGRDFYTPVATYWMTPMPVAGRYYSQRGMFVFHANDGAKWIISRLGGASGADRRYFVSQPLDLDSAPESAVFPWSGRPARKLTRQPSVTAAR